jgi:putative transposase
MPRPPRLDLAGIPQHIVQRGVDRRPCFILESHYAEYLRHLREQADRFGCQVHAYVLMCNHVHLLATALETGGVGRLMQSLGRRYVGFFNFSMERTGTLWEGRFKSCLVDTETYVLRCYRYIELNPVRAGVVETPGEFQWSSFRRNGLVRQDPVVTSHSAYESLGPTKEAQAESYRAIVAQGCPEADIANIRAMTARQRVFGGDQFRHRLEIEHSRPLGIAKLGRPRKSPEPERGV